MFQFIVLLVGLLFSIYGVYDFTSSYTCRIAPKGTMKTWCMRVAWIPSGLLVGACLCSAIMRSQQAF